MTDYVYLRDASFNRSGRPMSTSPRYHALGADGLAACSDRILLLQEDPTPIDTVPVSMLCKRPGCRKHFALNADQKGGVMSLNKSEVGSVEQALLYITNCNLATILVMAANKSRSSNEYERQISIAQSAIDWMKEFGVDHSIGLAADVEQYGSVKAFAVAHERKAQ